LESRAFARGLPCLTACVLLAACEPVAETPAPEPVDLLVTDAHILTVDDAFSTASVMAVDDGRVVAVGDAALAERYAPERTLALGGATVMPGFDDSHSHVQSYARHHIPMAGIESIAAIQDAVRAKAEALGPGAWITGYGWSEDELAEGRRPLRDDLDAAAPDNPVILTRAGGHSAVANSMALDVAEVNESTPQPEGGVIERGDDGRLNGVIRERQDIVARFAPEASFEELAESLEANLRALLPFGITSVTHASERVERWPVWRQVYTASGPGLPRAHVQMHWEGTEAMAAFRETAHEGIDTTRLELGPIKIFADGGFTGPAAFTKAPYVGQGDYRGYLNMPEVALRALIDKVHRAGWQLGIHAIGDAAIEITARALADALDATPREDHRHYLNHFSMRPSDETMETMAAHGIAITQQPNFTYTLAGRYSDNLDGWRLEHNNPLRSPMDHGIFVALSSDILPIGPMVGLYAATTRKGMDGRVYGPEEAITMAEAITAYTHGGAWLSFEEGERGRLVPGQYADFIVLSADPTAVEPEAIMAIEVEQTWIAGERVWARDAE
jgi:predicted amidohydrolase YtcJ